MGTNAQIDSIPQSIAQQEKAIGLVTNWINLITVGEDIDSLMEMTALPFALDRRELLNSEEELKSFYAKVTEKIGKQTPPKVASRIFNSKYEIIEKSIPLNILIIEITVLDGDLKDDIVFLTVNISGDEMKIVGFTD